MNNQIIKNTINLDWDFNEIRISKPYTCNIGTMWYNTDEKKLCVCTGMYNSRPTWSVVKDMCEDTRVIDNVSLDKINEKMKKLNDEMNALNILKLVKKYLHRMFQY